MRKVDAQQLDFSPSPSCMYTICGKQGIQARQLWHVGSIRNATIGHLMSKGEEGGLLPSIGESLEFRVLVNREPF